MVPAGADVRDYEERAQQRDEADRNVQKEDPPPVAVGDDQASDGWSRHGRYADHGTRDAEGGAAARGREDSHEDRQRLGSEHGGTDSLDDAGRDQLIGVLRESAEGRRRREHDEAGGEELARPKEVTEPAGGDRRNGKLKEEAVEDP